LSSMRTPKIESPRRAWGVCDRYGQLGQTELAAIARDLHRPLIAGAVQRFLSNGSLGEVN
jgi:hypothetical protein